MSCRTRMAPSPTGEYHIGHIRTVLYNYALAKKNNGHFIIRIEDTDRGRYVEGATERILDVIKNYGFTWDEGPRVGGKFGPYIQSERLALYKKYALELIDKKAAYYCFCTPERLEEMREKQKDAGNSITKCDRHCANLSIKEIEEKLKNNIPYVIRLRVPDNEDIVFHDEVLGDITINSNDIDDQVLLKSDGFPTYQLAVVVDDHLMEITHIMRGVDWVPSTPKHVLLYKAFGWDMPKHIHLPNLKELGGSKKLSKRYGSVAAIEFLQEGYIPEATLNFLMFLGWNPGTEKEIYTMEEFIADFSIERLQKTDLVSFDREKLLWYNGYYIRSYAPEDLYEMLVTWYKRFNPTAAFLTNTDKKYNVLVTKLLQERLKLLSEFDEHSSYFYLTPAVDKDMLLAYTDTKERAGQILSDFESLYVNTADWSASNLDRISHALISEKGYKPKEAFMTLRVALTGQTATPPVFEVAELLGKNEVVSRVKDSVKDL